MYIFTIMKSESNSILDTMHRFRCRKWTLASKINTSQQNVTVNQIILQCIPLFERQTLQIHRFKTKSRTNQTYFYAFTQHNSMFFLQWLFLPLIFHQDFHIGNSKICIGPYFSIKKLKLLALDISCYNCFRKYQYFSKHNSAAAHIFQS